MTQVASTLDVPLTEIDHPVTSSELRARYPELLYWFERRPFLAALLTGIGLVIAGVFTYYLLIELGGSLGLR